MRLDHRQRTGLFRHLPLFFLALGVLGFGWVAGAATPAAPIAPVSEADGSEDPEVLIRMYLEWMLRQMRAPIPADATSVSLAQAVISVYEESGTSHLDPLEVPEFVDVIVSTQALVKAHPDLVDSAMKLSLNEALSGMLADLVTEGRVAQ